MAEGTICIYLDDSEQHLSPTPCIPPVHLRFMESVCDEPFDTTVTFSTLQDSGKYAI